MPKDVLVVDDEAHVRRMLATVLDRTPEYRALIARSGLEAVQQAREAGPVVIVLDILIPGENGWQTLQELRAHPATRGIPVVILTPRGDEESQEHARAMGVSDCVAKPFTPFEVVAAIKVALTHES